MHPMMPAVCQWNKFPANPYILYHPLPQFTYIWSHALLVQHWLYWLSILDVFNLNAVSFITSQNEGIQEYSQEVYMRIQRDLGFLQGLEGLKGGTGAPSGGHWATRPEVNISNYPANQITDISLPFSVHVRNVARTSIFLFAGVIKYL